MNNKAIAQDKISNSLVCNTQPADILSATGCFKVECFDKDGNKKWQTESQNLVVNSGLQYMCGVGLTGTTQITSWYIGLYGSGSTNNPSASDTMSSHGGWTELTGYTSATRPICTFVAATNANPSVATNTASPALFTVNATATVGGAFLVSNNTKNGTTGTLFSAADFGSPGDRTVISGDAIYVTYTLSLAG